MAEKQPPIRMTRHRGGLIPLEAVDADRIAALPWNQPVDVTVSSRRSSQNHRHFYAVLSRLVKAGAVPPYGRVEELVEAIKLDLGYVTPVARLGGEVVLVPRSIDWATMDEAEFRDFKERAFARLAEVYGIPIGDIADPRIRSAA